MVSNAGFGEEIVDLQAVPQGRHQSLLLLYGTPQASWMNRGFQHPGHIIWFLVTQRHVAHGPSGCFLSFGFFLVFSVGFLSYDGSAL